MKRNIWKLATIVALATFTLNLYGGPNHRGHRKDRKLRTSRSCRKIFRVRVFWRR